MGTTDITKRSHTGIEILRILAMLMIISLHYLTHGGILQTSLFSTNCILSWLIEAFCIVGVNCYVLITGYFLVKSSGFKFNKLCNLWTQVFFYSLGIFLFFSSFNIVTFQFKDLLKNILPIKFTIYWFVTAYIGLYIVSPYLNKLITILNKKDYQKFLLVLLGLFSIYSFIGDTFHVIGGYSLVWFIILYFIGAYIRLFVDFDKKYKILLIYFAMSFCIFISKIVIYNISFYYGFQGKGSDIFFAYNSPTLLVSSVALFLFFKDAQVHNKLLIHLINFFAPLTFGVYLIHDNPFIRTNLWKNWLHTPAFYSSHYFFLHYFISVITVFIICAFIEKIRQIIFHNINTCYISFLKKPDYK